MSSYLGPERRRSANAEELVDAFRRLLASLQDVLKQEGTGAVLFAGTDALDEVVPADETYIYEVDESIGRLKPALFRGDADPDELFRSFVEFGEGLIGWAVERRRPVWTNRAHLDPRSSPVPGVADGPKAMIVIPLLPRGSVSGAIAIVRLGENASFTEHEFELTQRFGDVFALAFANQEMSAQLEHRANVDSLTGLFNHGYFKQNLQAMLDDDREEIVSVVMFDIDNFKAVNDTYGHAVGDDVLEKVAAIALSWTNLSGACCRTGGEEFSLILPGVGHDKAAEVAAKLARRIREADFGPVSQVTVSIGVAEGPSHGANARELANAADVALIAAKRAGKDRVVTYHAALRADIGEEGIPA